MNATFDATELHSIQSVLERMRAAWGAGDAVAYADNFSEDAQYVEAPGRRVHGRRAIAESHQRIFDTVFRKTRVSGRGEPIIWPISPQVALVEASGAVVFPGEDPAKVPANGLMTLIVRREGDAWKIISFQNTPTGRFRMLRMVLRILWSRLRQDGHRLTPASGNSPA
jgi:uncharacterized protein (TIGR02246 family)